MLTSSNFVTFLLSQQTFKITHMTTVREHQWHGLDKGVRKKNNCSF